MIYEAVVAPTRSRRFYCTRTNAFQPVYHPLDAQPLGIQIARVQHIGARSHGVAITFTDVRSIVLLPSCNGKLDKKKEEEEKGKRKKGEKRRKKRGGRTFIVGIEFCRHGKSFIDTSVLGTSLDKSPLPDKYDL